MNLAEEDQHFALELHEVQKKERISYARDFLLSLSEKDVCKKLPSEFDPSILKDFEGFSRTLQDRQKTTGNVSAQSFRRNEYGSSPPTRGDSSNYSRASHGRWDTRSRDSESQSDLDSDSGRRYGNKSQRSWQSPPEHDGLLGSGSFPKASSGHASSSSAPKLRTNDPGQLKKSSEPYQPPRPYKAIPHLRRATHDTLNDETFGTGDTSDDRTEEERKRRESFDLMRKEQHRAFQEKHKPNSDTSKDTSDIARLLDGFKDETLFSNVNNNANDFCIIPTPNNEDKKTVLASQALASRPTVPPGFTATTLEKNIGTKSVAISQQKEIDTSTLKDFLSIGGGTILNVTSVHHEAKKLGQKFPLGEQESISTPFTQLNQMSKLHSGFDLEKDTGKSTLFESGDDHSTSVLEKIFGNASIAKTGDSAISTKHQDSKRDDTWSPRIMQSSKFAHWFGEEKKPDEDLLLAKPDDLLSLIVGGEEARFQASDSKPTGKTQPIFPLLNSDFSKLDMISDFTPSTFGTIHKQFKNTNKPETVPLPGILTCEDLEHSILSEVSDEKIALPLPPPVQDLNVFEGKVGQESKTIIDNRASQHLLSLLNKGSGLSNDGASSSSSNLDTESLDRHNDFKIPKEETSQKSHDVGKNLTLETLFGSAFMNELQSYETPVSVHWAPVVPARIDDSGGSLSQSIFDDTRTNFTSHIRQTELDRVEGRRLGFNNPRTEVSFDIRLPEEDSLILASNPLNNPMFMGPGEPSKAELLGQEGLPFLRMPSQNQSIQPDLRYQNLRGPQINHGMSMFNPLDSQQAHQNAQMNFPDRIFHQDSPPLNQHISANMMFRNHHSNNQGFNPPHHNQNHPMLQQMQRPGVYSSCHPIQQQRFPGNAQWNPHLNNQPGGFVREQDYMHGQHRLPNFGGPGLPLQAPDIGGMSNHPEVLQRLLEMELNQSLPPRGGGGGGGGGREQPPDMGFRYR